MENEIVRHRWWIVGGSFGLLVVTLLVYGWNFHFQGPSSNNQDWGVFGDFLSGFLGATFGFITIALLVFFEHDRATEALHKEDLETIDNSINQNRKIFDSISLYVRDYSNINRGGPSSNTITMLRKSGPEAFFELYRNDFLAHYFKYLQVYISLNTFDFVNSLSLASVNALINKIGAQHPGISRQVYATPTTSPQDTLMRFHNSQPLQDEFQFYSLGIEEIITKAVKESSENLDPNLIKRIIDDAFNDFYNNSGHIYAHYIRNQFYVFESISSNNLKESEKERLFKLYRSHLSAYELVIMFYNCLSNKSKPKYNSYILDNKIFDDLEIVNFIHAPFFKKYGYSLINTKI